MYESKRSAHSNDKPGWGVDINEELALKYPCKFREHAHDWLLARYLQEQSAAEMTATPQQSM